MLWGRDTWVYLLGQLVGIYLHHGVDTIITESPIQQDVVPQGR